ncbi:ABC transporter permease subunit [Uliginosibacterium sp. H3]|uniref:ABC transporter permease subunit n=1 Tax=Uliginosibacterium silvisoli TaxID=3114758 RepID=A0ABU6K9D9_9RHOO|nr:ABC transporter permease subunit [Uliginosibacterium sp. H3]MEC5388221.1 ABC transporter permease subunit [Uliginosibacterium sp. H3]
MPAKPHPLIASRPPPPDNRRTAYIWRNRALQLVVLAIIGLLVWYLIGNTLANMRARGAHAGFDFLLDPAGFEISEGLFGYESGQPFWRAFLVGLGNTVRVALSSIVVCTVLGTLLGIGRLSRNFLLRSLCTAYVELVRNVPILLQLLMWYFVLSDMLPTSDEALSPLPGLFLSKSGLVFPVPASPLSWIYAGAGLLLGVTASFLHLRRASRVLSDSGRQLPRVWPVVLMVCGGIALGYALGGLIGDTGWAFDLPEKSEINISGGAAVTPEFLAVFLGLSTYTAAFVAEVVRAGVQSVQHGQLEAARALGLGRVQQLRLVILPQAMRVILPSLTNQYLNLTKNSSLAVAVGYPDLVSIANTSLNQTGRAFECVAIIMAVYVSLSILTALFMHRFNRRADLKGLA